MKNITVRKRCTQEHSDGGRCKGEMIRTGAAFQNSISTSYDHECNVCNHKKSFVGKAYPHNYNEYDPDEIVERWL